MLPARAPAAPGTCSRWPGGAERLLSTAGTNAAGTGSEGKLSLLELTAPVRSQIFYNMVGDLLCYSGAKEVNIHLDTLRRICRELRDQIDEECLTFNYDDTCDLGGSNGQREIRLLNAWIRRHPRLKYFECMLRSVSKFRALLEDLVLPDGTRCSFVLEFKVNANDVRRLLQRFRVRRLNVIPEESTEDSAARANEWGILDGTHLHTLCMRSCSDEIVRSMLAGSPNLQALQIVDSQVLADPCVQASRLVSLCLTGVITPPDDQLSRWITGCRTLRSLYISKCHISHLTVSLPHLELLSITHCRQLTDACASELLHESNNPSLRFIDFTEDRGLSSPCISHPGLEIAWLMHCPQLTDQALATMFQSCPNLSSANLVQSSIENAIICSPALRTLELTTSQKLTDNAVTQLLQHCPCLTFLDVGHCCQLIEPKFEHETLETILLSFCVNLRESAIEGLFANCSSLRYVELAVCMFDMTRFQKECGPNCQVVVNFDF